MSKAMQLRSVYGPAHFGNFYELAAPLEMRSLLSEWKAYGINGYSTWFDPYDVPDPFSDDPLYFWPRHRAVKLWRRKRSVLRTTQELGLETGICLTANSVYMDQLYPELAADAGDKAHIIGPNLCPSHPESLDIMRKNMSNLAKFLAEEGVRVNYLPVAFYDWGGCDCEKCRPWIKTVLEFCEKEIVPAAREYQPEMKVQFCTWFLKEEENSFFEELFSRKPEWLDGILISPGYKTEWSGMNVPKPYSKMLFLHISYSADPTDRYGRNGAVVSPERLEKIFRRCAEEGDIDGFQAYSEGIYDELNKFLIGHLGRDPLADVRGLVAEYCRRHFDTNTDDTEKLVDAIYRLERLAANPGDAEEISAVLERLADTYDLKNNWRFEMMRLRPLITAIDRQIGDEEQWEQKTKSLDAEERRRFVDSINRLVEERQRLLERLEREVYRIGMQITVMHMDLEHDAWREWSRGITADEHRKDSEGFIA